MADFPRGGASALTPLEVRKIKESATQDVLFGKTTEKKTKREKSKKKDATSEVGDGSLRFDSGLKSADALSFKKLNEGMKLLGCIKEIQATELIVSLPNSLTGYVPITNVHEVLNDQLQKSLNEDDEGNEDNEESNALLDLHDLFSVGQFVPTIIGGLHLGKHGYKKISLSVDPSQLNSGLKSSHIIENMILWGFVSSIEDHGCIISFGIKGVNGFIASSEKGSLKLGSVQWFLVKKIKGRVLTLSANMEDAKSAKYTDEDALVLDSLHPGALVNAVTAQVFSKGISVSFNGFQGIVDTIHLPDRGAETENKDKKKKKLKCRIIYVNPSNKKIGLSATSDVITLKSDSNSDRVIGDVQECTVLRNEPTSGLLVELNDGKKGFVHISKVSDERVEKIGKKFKVGSVHKGRIFGFNGLDGLYSVSFEKSIIEQPFLRYVDIKPGTIVDGTIITLEDFGMLVKLSDHIKGLCPKTHLADINLKHPEKKLIDGKKVKCRVLHVNPEKKRLTLTHKKTLVNSELPIATNYKGLKRGMQLHGFIDSIREHGLVIRFYNLVKGFAPKSHLGLQEDENMADVFYVGQVVKCKVLHCNPEEKKLKLTFKSDEELSRPQETKTSLKLFDKTDGIFLEVKNDCLCIQLQDVKKTYLKMEHLSDFKCHQKGWMFLYQTAAEGLRNLKDLVYLGELRKRHLVSNKNLLRIAAESKECVTDFNQIKVGVQTVGVVHHIMQYGIFVELAQGIVGLAPNSNLADYFVSNPSSHFNVGQTVLVKVNEIDLERKRFLVTLNPSVVDLIDSKVLCNAVKGENLLESLVKEREELLAEVKKLSAGPIQSLPEMLGQTVQAKVMTVRQEGVRLQTESGSNGFIPDKLRAGVDVETGDVVTCLVIDIDTDDWLFIGTLIPEVIDSMASDHKGSEKVKKGEDVEVTVQRILPDYIIAAIPKRAIPVAYIVAREHLNDIRDVSKRYFVGQKLRATVASTTSSGPVLVCEDSFVDGKPKLGSVVTASVKAVKANQVNVSLRNAKLHGRIYISEVWDEIKVGHCPLDDFKNGESIRCKITGFRDVKTNKYLPITHQQSSKVFAELSCRPSVINATSDGSVDEPKEIREFKQGETIPCYVKAVSENFMTVFVNPKVYGKVSVLHSSTDKRILKHFTSHFKHGAAYNATVLRSSPDDDNLDLSLVGIITEIKKNAVVCGKITKVLPRFGLLIELPGHKCGFAHVTELHDEYKDDPLEEYKPKMFVKCCILSTNNEDQIDLSLRHSRLSTDESEVTEIKDRSIHSMDDIHENDILRGYVKACSSCGVFVSLSAKIVGRVQIKNLSKYFVKNWQELFPVGKLVKAKVLSINSSTNQIELSLRGPDVHDKDPAPPPPKRVRTESEGSETHKKRKRKDSGDLHIELREDEDSDDDELDLMKEDDAEDDSEDDETEVANNKESTNEALPRLTLPGGFDWTANQEDELQKRKHDSESESEDDEEKTPAAKRTKRQKRAEKKAEEEYLYKTELALLDKDRGPETAEDFDRLLLGSPNNSMLWIQYMAFYLNSAEIEKARAIAERALKAISFREEQEKLNVWIALLNLECLYGTDESVQNVFNEAVKRNEPKKIFLKTADIYIRHKKNEKAEKLYQVTTKRFNASKKVWINYGFYLMKNGKTDAARKLLQRSLQSLPVRKHINTILKFALMEFKFGEAEKGVTMFESVLKNHPKRTDIWSVYIDMLIKDGEHEQVRNVFERIITLNVSTKKMKFVFKRYLEFEKKYGDDKRMEGVKSKAMEYVASKTELN